MKYIAVRYGIRNSFMLNRIANFLISNAGNEFTFNSIKNSFGLKSVQTVIDYIYYLENAYLIFTMPKFSYSYRQQSISPKKSYSIDNGLSLVNTVSFSKDKGRMLENAVFLHLRRKYKEIFYFRKNGECDFLIKERGKICKAIQACFSLNEENTKRETEALLEALKEFGLSEGLIITESQKDEFLIEGKKIRAIPAWEWMGKAGH